MLAKEEVNLPLSQKSGKLPYLGIKDGKRLINLAPSSMMEKSKSDS